MYEEICLLSDVKKRFPDIKRSGKGVTNNYLIKLLSTYDRNIFPCSNSDINAIILSFLDFKSLMNVSRINKYLNKIILSDEYDNWKHLIARSTSLDVLPQILKLKDTKLDWIKIYENITLEPVEAFEYIITIPKLSFLLRFFTNNLTNAHYNRCFYIARILRHRDAFRSLISSRRDNTGILHTVLRLEYMDIVHTILEKGIRIKAGDSFVYDCIELIRQKDKRTIKLLVENGLNIHGFEEQMLYWAIGGKNIEMVEYLIELGANINARKGKMLRDAKKAFPDNF